jgi:hypothetical protein
VPPRRTKRVRTAPRGCTSLWCMWPAITARTRSPMPSMRWIASARSRSPQSPPGLPKSLPKMSAGLLAEAERPVVRQDHQVAMLRVRAASTIAAADCRIVCTP